MEPSRRGRVCASRYQILICNDPGAAAAAALVGPTNEELLTGGDEDGRESNVSTIE